MKMQTPRFMLVVFAAALLLSGCSNRLARINYINGSYSFLTYDDAIVQVSGEPENITRLLSDLVRSQNGNIVEKKDLDKYPVITEENRKCWRARKELSDRLTQANDRNDYRAVRRVRSPEICAKHEVPCLNKKACFGCNCSYLDWKEEGLRKSFRMTVDFDPRTATAIETRQHSAAVGTLVGGWSSSHSMAMPFLSRLRFVVWKTKGDRRTNILLEAVPVEAKTMSEPGFGNSIGYAWWGDVKGVKEADLVKAYKILLRDLDEKKYFTKRAE